MARRAVALVLACLLARYPASAADEVRILENPFHPTPFSLPPRVGATLVEMGNGSWLVAGGTDPRTGTRPEAFVFTPGPYQRRMEAARSGQGGTWKRTAPMRFERAFATGALLADGRVLIAGGFDRRGHPRVEAEVFDPRRGTWCRVGDLDSPRAGAAATRLRNHRILVVGGYRGPHRPTATVETFDPGHDEFDAHPWRLAEPAAFPAVCRLDDGDVLITGGWTGHHASDQLLLFDDRGGPFDPRAGSPRHPMSRGSFRDHGRLAGRRAGHRMRRLGDVVLIEGGRDGEPCRLSPPADPPEVWDPVRPHRTSAFEEIGPLDPREPMTIASPEGDPPVACGLPPCMDESIPAPRPSLLLWIFPTDRRWPWDGERWYRETPVRLEPRDRVWPFPASTRDPRPDERPAGWPDLVQRTSP